MSSPGQKRGSCGHAMAIFDGHAFCARCMEKGKGEEPCIANKDTADCTLCNSFTPEQRAQIATPSYKIKKEKREAKRVDNTQLTDELVDPSSVSIIGVVSGPSADKSPAPPEKKPKKDKPPTKSKKSSSALSYATEDKFSALEDKWADRFNRLEALLLARSIEPTFSSDVRVAPDHPPPGNVTRDSEPFFQPSDKPLDNSQRTGPDSSAALQPSAGKLTTDPALQGSSTVKRTGPDNITSQQKSAGTQGRTGPDTASQKQKSTGKPSTDSHRPSTLSAEASDHPPSDRPYSSTGSFSLTPQKGRKDSISSLDSDTQSQLSDTPPVELFIEQGDLSDDQEFDQELPTSEEQTYRETMRGIRSFMGWSHIPDMDSSNPSDDNPSAGPKAPAPSKISVQMPTEDWLCRKLSKLNLNMTEGYPSRTTEAGSLPMDHFLRPPKPQTKWYGLYSDQQLDPATVTSWHTGPAKLNNSFGRIARKAALAATPPASRRISQDMLRRWERTAREASVVCNQTASFNRCLFKVQGDMQAQLKVIRSENKGKVSKKLSEAAEELQFLMEFNSSITQATAKAMEHLTDFVFITMGNLALARRDSYLSHLKNGVKPDTFAGLRTGPLHIATLFSESVVKKAEEEIALYDNKSHPTATPSHARHRYHPYEQADKKQESRSEGKQDRPAWKNINRRPFKRGRGKASTSLPDLPAVSNIINDNYCLNRDTSQLLTRNFHTNETMNNLLNLDVKPLVVKFAPSAPGLPQRKGISPGVPECQLKKCQLKSVKSASCVTRLSCVNSVSTVPNVALTLPVGARLQNFWQTWLDLGAGPKVVQILQEGYTLPFRIRPKLTRIPTVISCYANPLRNSYLLEALHQLIDKNAVEPVSNQTSLGFYNRLFLVPKPNNKWRPILDLSNLNQFLKVEKFKMETPETIRTSLLQGEWVTSVDSIYRYRNSPGNTSDFRSRTGPTSLKLWLLVCPQRPWSSL